MRCTGNSPVASPTKSFQAQPNNNNPSTLENSRKGEMGRPGQRGGRPRMTVHPATTTAATVNKAITNPAGWAQIARSHNPCIVQENAVVIPQVGHGRPVVRSIPQGANPSC